MSPRRGMVYVTARPSGPAFVTVGEMYLRSTNTLSQNPSDAHDCPCPARNAPSARAAACIPTGRAAPPHPKKQIVQRRRAGGRALGRSLAEHLGDWVHHLRFPTLAAAVSDPGPLPAIWHTTRRRVCKRPRGAHASRRAGAATTLVLGVSGTSADTAASMPSEAWSICAHSNAVSVRAMECRDERPRRRHLLAHRTLGRHPRHSCRSPIAEIGLLRWCNFGTLGRMVSFSRLLGAPMRHPPAASARSPSRRAPSAAPASASRSSLPSPPRHAITCRHCCRPMPRPIPGA